MVIVVVCKQQQEMVIKKGNEQVTFSLVPKIAGGNPVLPLSPCPTVVKDMYSCTHAIQSLTKPHIYLFICTTKDLDEVTIGRIYKIFLGKLKLNGLWWANPLVLRAYY